MRAKNLEDVLVYQKANSALVAVCAILRRPAVRRDFDLWDQLNRSSGCFAALIAEGFGQGSDRHVATYLSRARGSAHETRAHLERAFRKDYISKTELSDVGDLYIEIGKMLTSWINYLSIVVAGKIAANERPKQAANAVNDQRSAEGCRLA